MFILFGNVPDIAFALSRVLSHLIMKKSAKRHNFRDYGDFFVL